MTHLEFTIEELATEEWRDAFGYEQMYEVSNLGRVRRKPRLLNPFVDRYAFVTLRVNGKAKHKKELLHQVIARTFFGAADGLYVNHKDGVKTNNRRENLEYVTPAQNSRHAVENGLSPTGLRSGRHTMPESYISRRGNNINTSKLQAADVLAIRADYETGMSRAAIARKHGVGWGSVDKIVKREHWAHI